MRNSFCLVFKAPLALVKATRVSVSRLLFCSGLLFGSGLLFSSGLSAEESIPQEKLEAIRTLMQVTGAEANTEQFSSAFTHQIVSVLRTRNPELSAKAIAIVGEEVAKVVAEELANESLQLQIFPIYAKYFTLQELQALIEFNKSATGIKANKVMPMLMGESMNAAEVWTQYVAPRVSERVLKRFKDEGISILPVAN
jgi:hypothetical protein